MPGRVYPRLKETDQGFEPERGAIVYAYGVVWLRYTEFCPKFEAQVLGKQLLRSGTSVGANYREAHRGRSKAEFIAKCGDSFRELEESAYWLELLVDGEIVAAAKLLPLLTECDELTAIFVTIIKRAKDTS